MSCILSWSGLKGSQISALWMKKMCNRKNYILLTRILTGPRTWIKGLGELSDKRSWSRNEKKGGKKMNDRLSSHILMETYWIWYRIRWKNISSFMKQTLDFMYRHRISWDWFSRIRFYEVIVFYMGAGCEIVFPFPCGKPFDFLNCPFKLVKSAVKGDNRGVYCNNIILNQGLRGLLGYLPVN